MKYFKSIIAKIIKRNGTNFNKVIDEYTSSEDIKKYIDEILSEIVKIKGQK
jgi:spore maturation protein CgeB